MMKLYDSIIGCGAVEALEQKFAEYIGTRFAVAMTNCTSALHAALLASGVKRGDEVIVPAYTWGGTIAGLLHIGAVPVFADIDDTLTLDVEDVSRKVTHKTKAIIAVHLFGHPCHMDRLKSLCQEYDLALIEDCAQAFGARFRGQHVGSFGTGCFSFGYTKPICAGEGGMITTDSADIYDRILFFTQHPLRQRKDMIDFREPNQFSLNYHIHPLTAKSVLESFDAALQLLEDKKSRYSSLHSAILDTPMKGLKPVTIADGAEHSWHKYSQELLPSLTESEHKSIRAFLEEHGYLVEDGYIKAPLYSHSSLKYYLTRRSFRMVQQLSLPATEIACRKRAGIAIRNELKERDD
ncbi:DegT/DnrJ/EryC1/StrS family aminotransferase [Candidatus Poribacteria bacterium]